MKTRVGRQEMAFDLQRFVSVRDGPNVRQAYDAAWLDWEQRQWCVIGFWSQHSDCPMNPGVEKANPSREPSTIRVKS